MTIKFYTDTDRYMGVILKYNYGKHYAEVKSWLDSGNKIVIIK